MSVRTGHHGQSFCYLRRCVAMLAVVSIWVIVGCKKKELALDPPAPLAPEHAPARQDVILAHNERVAKLATTNSQGVIELRWTDNKGKHFEQGDLELWQTTGDRTAVDISKIGQRLLWMGSNAEQWWLFDMMTKGDHVLFRGTQDEAGEQMGALGVTPLALLDLLGLSPIDATDGLDKPIAFDASLGAWSLDSNGRGGRLRIAFDLNTLLPKQIELLDVAGLVVATSTLTRYEAVDVPGMAIMARPKMPRTIDIRRTPAAGDEMAGDAKIAFNDTVGRIEPKLEARIFDLERLIASLQPDRIETTQP